MSFINLNFIDYLKLLIINLHVKIRLHSFYLYPFNGKYFGKWFYTLELHNLVDFADT